MSSYQVVIPKPVQKQLDTLPHKIREKVIEGIITLKENPRPHSCVKLRGYKNEYRIRIGAYRVRYEIHKSESTVVILHCKHRKDIYGR